LALLFAAQKRLNVGGGRSVIFDQVRPVWFDIWQCDVPDDAGLYGDAMVAWRSFLLRKNVSTGVE